MNDSLGFLADAMEGRYHIERELGAGGMATVYLAEDLKHQRKVAIKVLRRDLAESLGAERFLREIRTTAQLQHPHIVALLDSGDVRIESPNDAGGSYTALYYVMPYIDGETLRARLERDGPFSSVETARLLAEVADALAYAHARGIVHRDIKPENVMLSGRHALVADFGIARAIAAGTSEHGAIARQTMLGVALGTPAYMSPEQATADPAVDYRSDIYALGVVGYEMLIGVAPFHGTPQQVLMAQVTQQPVPVTDQRPDVPATLASVIMRCLDKDPEKRPQSGAELLRVLEDPTTTGSVTAPSASRLPSGPGRTVWAVAAVAIALVLVGAASKDGRARIASALHLSQVAASRGDTTTSVPGTDAARSIVVLPFDNLSADTSNAYFAAGIQEEVLTRLAGIHELKVISRTSAAQYASHPQDIAQVARQLGVATVLEGSVQKAGDQVRVNVQLIDAHSNAHVWAQTYDRKVKNIFSVESDVAQSVAEALKAQLLPAEAARVANSPTRSSAAYDLFLQAEYTSRQVDEGTATDPAAMAERGVHLYEQAIAADSSFALAYARLSYLEGYMYWFGLDQSQSHLTRQTKTAVHALALDPALPEAHLAMGFVHYWGHRDYTAALREFETARQSLPNDARVVTAIAYIDRRRGNPQAAMAGLQRAMVLDPRNPLWPQTLGSTLVMLRRYNEAITAFEHAAAVRPAEYEAVMEEGWTMLLNAQPERARRLLATLPAGVDPNGEGSATRFETEWIMRRPDSALAALAHAPALVRPQWPNAGIPADVFRGRAWAARGDSAHAHTAYDAARRVLEAQLRTDANNPDAWSWLGVVYAGLGRAADAIHAGQRATEVLPISRDAFDGPSYAVRLAEVYAHVGDAGKAVAILRRLLAIPAGGHASVQLLRIDPIWDPIRADPRFKALLTTSAQSSVTVR